MMIKIDNQFFSGIYNHLANRKIIYVLFLFSINIHLFANATTTKLAINKDSTFTQKTSVNSKIILVDGASIFEAEETTIATTKKPKSGKASTILKRKTKLYRVETSEKQNSRIAEGNEKKLVLSKSLGVLFLKKLYAEKLILDGGSGKILFVNSSKAILIATILQLKKSKMRKLCLIGKHNFRGNTHRIRPPPKLNEKNQFLIFLILETNNKNFYI